MKARSSTGDLGRGAERRLPCRTGTAAAGGFLADRARRRVAAGLLQAPMPSHSRPGCPPQVRLGQGVTAQAGPAACPENCTSPPACQHVCRACGIAAASPPTHSKRPLTKWAASAATFLPARLPACPADYCHASALFSYALDSTSDDPHQRTSDFNHFVSTPARLPACWIGRLAGRQGPWHLLTLSVC